MLEHNFIFFQFILCLILANLIISTIKFESNTNITKFNIEKIINILFFENTYDFNIITSLKNDMIIELISKNNFQRFFFRLNPNESYIFTDSTVNIIKKYESNVDEHFKNEIETLPITIAIKSDVKNKYEKNKFFASITKNKLYIEKFDFNNISNYFNSSIYFPKYEIVAQISSSLQFYDIINNLNYFIFTTIIKKNNSYNLLLFKYTFYKDQNKIYFNLISKQDIKCSKGKIISCFINPKNIISCFYLNDKANYTITLFDTELNIKNNLILKYQRNFKENHFHFFKSINFGNNIGIYLFFPNEIPITLIKNISNVYSITNVLSLYEEIKLYDYNFNNEIMLNDLINISATKFCYISTSKNKEILIISIFSLYDNFKQL